MADFQLVDPQGWEWDLQSIYSAYMNHFQLHNVSWYDRSWGHLFTTFEAFLAYGWPVIVITDSWTGRAHIVTRTTSIGAFLKMIKTRFGESLPLVDNMLRVSPFETQNRHLRTVSDVNSYKKLHGTLPASVLAAQKLRVRSGEPKRVQDLWERKDKTFLAVDFEWSERNITSCLEWGYTAVRCGHLDAMGIWPPVPETNYRKGHYIVAEYVDKVHNKHCPTFPWEYAFGESQVVSKAKLGEIVQATISSLASPDSETIPNQLILVAHGVGGDLERLADLKVKLPNNVLVIDTAAFERQLFSKGHRGAMIDTQTNKPRQPGTTLSLSNTLRSLKTDLGCTWHCSGNDAFGALLALQLLLDPEGTQIPVARLNRRSASRSPGPALYTSANTSLGPGQITPPFSSLTPAPRSPIAASLAPPRPISGYIEDFEALAQGRHRQGGGQRRSPGRSGQQSPQKENPPSAFRSAAGSTVWNGVNETAKGKGGSRTGGRTPRRYSSGAVEAFSQGMSQLSTR